MPRITPPVQKISQRLHLTQDLAQGRAVSLDDKQAHYLRNVLRLEVGASLFLFNGRDGEWRGRIAALTKKQVVIEAEAQTRPQDTPNDIWLLVAPVKKDRLDYLAQKATEMGVGTAFFAVVSISAIIRKRVSAFIVRKVPPILAVAGITLKALPASSFVSEITA